jgi:hypothetical protein
MPRADMNKSSASSLWPQPLHMRPRWNELREIGNSRIAKSSAAIPIVGYMLIFNDEVVRYLRIHTDFCQGTACGATWRLSYFYFGCCFIALGSALYAIFCPSLIKKYKNALTFFEAEKEYLSHSTNLIHLFSRIRSVKGADPDDPNDLLNTVVAKNDGLTRERFNILAGPVSEYYYHENRINAPARICTVSAYSIGGIFLLIPTVVTAFQIARRIVLDALY